MMTLQLIFRPLFFLPFFHNFFYFFSERGEHGVCSRLYDDDAPAVSKLQVQVRGPSAVARPALSVVK